MLKNTVGGIEDPFEVGNLSEVALPNLYLFILFLIPLARNSFEHLEVLSLFLSLSLSLSLHIYIYIKQNY